MKLAGLMIGFGSTQNNPSYTKLHEGKDIGRSVNGSKMADIADFADGSKIVDIVDFADGSKIMDIADFADGSKIADITDFADSSDFVAGMDVADVHIAPGGGTLAGLVEILYGVSVPQDSEKLDEVVKVLALVKWSSRLPPGLEASVS